MLSYILQASTFELVLAAVGFTVLYRVYLYLTVGAARRRMIKENGCKPVRKYPNLDPYFGLDFIFELGKLSKEKKLLQSGAERLRKYGYTFRLKILGEDIISTAEPENIKTVLATKFPDFELAKIRKIAFHPLFGKGIFTTDGAEWEHSRAMLRPNFSRSQVADLDTFETHVSHLIKAIPKDGSTVDLQDLFFELTVDSATEFLFGESANTLLSIGSDKSGEESFSEAFTYTTTKLADNFRGILFRSGLVTFGSREEKLVRCRKIVHDFVDRYVQRALEHLRKEAQGGGAGASGDEKKKYVFLYELARQTQDPGALRSESLNILLAGRDTTASLLGSLWNTLSKRPDVWAQLQAEVDQLGGRRPTFEEIKNMKYLRYVLNETLRLYPVVPGNSRTAVRDTVLPRGGGPDGKSPIFVRKGVTFQYSVYTMHRRQDIYGPDAEEFKPERWESLRPGWEYLPFNGGPRICLGQQFALTEASYATIRLMQHFRTIESRDPRPWAEGMTITCASGYGAKVALGQ